MVHGFSALAVRRWAIFIAVVFTLTLAVPARVLAGSDGGFPLSWLWNWAASPAWSSNAFIGQPVQERGADYGGVRGHYVPAEATRAKGGNGRAADRVLGGLEPYAPHEPDVQPGAAGSGGSGPGSDATVAANVAPQVALRHPANNQIARTLTPQLVVRAHDPDRSPNLGLRYLFRVYNEAGTTQLASSGWIASASWPVPSGTLAWGGTYLWTVQVYDQASYSAVYPAYAFFTPVPQPQLTSRLADNPDKGFDPSTGNYTTSATDASVETIGPELEIVRSYNSVDVREGAFGRSWTSILDTRATEAKDAKGTLQTVVVTYPDGQDVAFGREANGSFTSPAGRFSSFVTTTGGYTLTAKDATVYRFTQAAGSGVYKIASITDANGRALTFTYNASGYATQLRSASGRSLFFSWQTVDGKTRVRTVSTDPVTPGSASTALVWEYSYSTGNDLLKVCDPTTRTACTQYAYASTSQYANVVQDVGALSYWRLGDATGSSMARSTMLQHSGVDNGVYNNVVLGQPAALESSTATSAGFNGTSSYVKLPGRLITDGPHQSISVWFKTPAGSATGGVLVGTQSAPVTETPESYLPAIYVGTDGKLYGEFWTGSVAPISSTTTVNDGMWHHAVLAATADQQALYLDGRRVGTQNTPLRGSAYEMTHAYLGVSRWTNRPAATSMYGYFSGSMSDVAFFGQALTDATVEKLYGTGRSRSALTRITRPSGGVSAEITYDLATGRVESVKDENGGVWRMSPPSIAGNSDVYAASVLGGKPANYWRLSDIPGDTEAVNEVAGTAATYNANVTLGTAGPFADATAASFDGATSAVTNGQPLVDTSKSFSVSTWVKLGENTRHQRAVSIAGSRVSGVWLGYRTGDDRWQVTMYHADTATTPGNSRVSSAAAPTLNKWTHLVSTYNASNRALKLYVNGVLQGTATVSGTAWRAAGPLHIGRDLWDGALGNYWKGGIAEVAVFPSALSEAQVVSQYVASQQSAPVAIKKVATGVAPIVMPVSTVDVIDPGGKKLSYGYDVINGSRIVAQTDALGNTTKYGYDVGGYSSLTYDPNGVLTEEVSDVRGNTIQSITCQDQAARKCSSVYYTYFPDATTKVLTPDPRNDVMLTLRDGRSASATDNTYLTSYAYDAKGNQTEVAEPLGRKTSTVYNAMGLPVRVTSPGGGVETIEYNAAGDVVRSTEPLGKVISYTYDGVGRVVTSKEVTSSFPAGLTTAYAYDGLGRVITQTEPAVTNRVTGAVHTSMTTIEYNADGLVTRQTVSDITGGDAPRSVSTAYNAYGQMISETDANGDVTRYEYDAYGNMVKEIEPDGGQVVNAFDAEGNLLNSKVIGFIGNPNNPSPPTDLVTTSKAYDPAGRLASETDAMGFTTLYTYTDNDLIAKVSGTDGIKTFVVEDNVYDAAGNLTRQTTDNGATVMAYTYDAAGRQTSTTLDPAGLKRTTTLTYSPDDDVLTTTQTDASGTVVAYSEDLYDAEGNTLAETTYASLGLSPVGRWKLDGTADSAANGKLAVNGNVGWVTSPRAAATFEGSTSSYLSSPGPVVDTSRGFTVSAWAYPTESSRNRAVVAQEGNAQSGFYLKLDHNKGDKWSFVMYNRDEVASPANYATSTSTAVLNTWTHLAVVYDTGAKQLRLYVNGALQATKALGAEHVPWTARGPLTVGRLKWDSTFTDPWLGQISDVQVYQKVLSANDIGQIRSGAAPAADAGVIRTSYVRDSDGNAISEIDPRGHATDYSYDQEGRAVVTVGPAVSAETGSGGALVSARPVTTIGYNTFDEVVQTKDPNGNVSAIGYDAAGQVVSTTMPSYTPPGTSTPIRPVSSHQYDVSGNLTISTDPLGNITRYAYDQLGRMVKETAPNGGISTFTYDLGDELLSVTDPTGAVTSTTYDQLGNPLTVTEVVRQSGASYTTSYTYDNNGRLTGIRSPAGVAQSFTYNAAEEVLTSRDGAGRVTTNTYDGAGRLTKTLLPDGIFTTVTYDLTGRVLEQSAFGPTGILLTRESQRHDAAGNAIETTDARGTKHTFTYDPTGMVTSARQPVSATEAIVTSFGYDLTGNRTRFTDGRGNSFLSTYNPWNLPESVVEPATAAHSGVADRTFTMIYDAAERLVIERQPGGVSITTTYDSLGNVSGQSGTGAEAATAGRSFGYDAGGRMTSLSGPGGTNALTYDDRGLLLSVNGPSGSSSFTYNPDGAMLSRVDAAGTTSYGYDSAGRLKTVSNPAAAIDATLTYNTASLVDRIVYNSTGNARVVTYDHLHRPVEDKLVTPGGSTVARIGYGWDTNSNLVAKTTGGFTGAATNTNTYTYDLADRLASWSIGTTTVGYTYDKSGNRLTSGGRTFTYDERNRLVHGSDGTTYGYTPRGTLRTTTIGTIAVQTLADAFGQITRQYTESGSFRDYTYDGLGRVMRPGFAYTGLGNHLAADGDATYARDPDGDLLGVATSNEKRLAWTDLHTDVVGQFTATGTTLNGSTTYDPLGRVLQTAGLLGNLGYQSEWTDAFTSRVNMHARWYNTATAQFDSRDTAGNDPIPDSITANRYQYGDGDPLTVTDPTGHWGWNPFKRVTKAVSRAWKRTTSTVSRAYRSVKAKVGYAYSYAKRTYKKAKSTVKRYVKKAASYVKKKAKAAKKWVSKTVHRAKTWVKKKVNTAKSWVKKKVKTAKKWVAKKYHSAKKSVKKVYRHVKQAGKKIVHKAKRVVKKTANTVKDAYKATSKWVREHKAEIAGFVVGAVVGVGCGAAIGWTGVGAVACGALAGAAGSLVTGAMKGHRGMDLAKETLIGGTVGAVTAGLSSMARAGLSSGIRSALSGSGTRRALGAAGRAFTAEARNIAGGFANAGRGVVNAARGTAGSIKNAIRRPLCLHSFDPSTRVLMADGSAKAINDVKIGDQVAATEPGVGITAAKTVTHLHRNTDTDLTDVKVRNGKAGETTTLHTTQHHPFWSATKGAWSDAKDLSPGTKLGVAGAGEVTVVGVKNFTGHKTMRDLTVDGFHTYYVLAGSTPVLVHNCGNIERPAGARFSVNPRGEAADLHEQPWEWHEGFGWHVAETAQERPLSARPLNELGGPRDPLRPSPRTSKAGAWGEFILRMIKALGGGVD